MPGIEAPNRFAILVAHTQVRGRASCTFTALSANFALLQRVVFSLTLPLFLGLPRLTKSVGPDRQKIRRFSFFFSFFFFLFI